MNFIAKYCFAGVNGMKIENIATLSLFLMASPSWAQVPNDVIRPIVSFEITLMPPGKGQKPFGWIQLLDNTGKSSGYIYLEDSDDAPHLGGGGTYVVTHLPYSELSAIISILKSGKQLQIRYAASGVQPSVFIEKSGSVQAADVANAAILRKSL